MGGGHLRFLGVLRDTSAPQFIKALFSSSFENGLHSRIQLDGFRGPVGLEACCFSFGVTATQHAAEATDWSDTTAPASCAFE